MIGEITESYSGGTPSVANHSYYGGSIPFIRSAEINSINTELYLTEEGLNSSSAKLVEEGDILYALYGATSGEVGISQINGAINQAILAIKPKSKYDPNFIMQWLRRQKNSIISTYLQGGQGNLSGAIVKDLILSVPIEYDEQIRIGAFFKQLDNTITLHQEAIQRQQDLKKALLQKLFPVNGERIPTVRFANFKEKWEQRKLNSIVERITRKNKNLESNLPLTISAQYGLVDQSTFFKKQVASKDVSGYFLVKKGEFAYNKSYSSGYPWGAIKRLDNYDKGVLSTLYIVFKPKKIESDFLMSYYDTNFWHKEVSVRAAEGARNHGLLNISAQDFFETELIIPIKPEEQSKIGAFFKQLDETITLHQQALDKLNLLKQSLLQKMFVN